MSRLFEYTEEDIAAIIKDGGKILLDKLIRPPCIFMREEVDDQLACVGVIARAWITGTEVSIECTCDLDIPPLLNSTIYANKIDFDMPHDFEFSRTHWAVKDVDLYRVLIRNTRPRTQRPHVFSITEHEKIEPTLVSAMMPFDAGFTAIYDDPRSASQFINVSTAMPVRPLSARELLAELGGMGHRISTRAQAQGPAANTAAPRSGSDKWEAALGKLRERRTASGRNDAAREKDNQPGRGGWRAPSS